MINSGYFRLVLLPTRRHCTLSRQAEECACGPEPFRRVGATVRRPGPRG